jgi:hypothetical protein
MRLAIILGALAALAVAVPYPQEDDTPDEPDTVSDLLPTITVPAILTTSLNIPVTQLPSLTFLTKSKRPHWEPIPIFSKECKCNIATVRYPCWATDSLQVSTLFQTVHKPATSQKQPILTSQSRNATTKKTSHTAATWKPQADVPRPHAPYALLSLLFNHKSQHAY